MSVAKRAGAQALTPVRVLLVDDQQMLTEALATRLVHTPDIVVVGHCTTRDAHPELLVTRLRPDVITIEVAQARDAAALLTLLRTAWPAARFVVLTASHDPEQAVHAARAGADGWVSKQSSIDTLVHALRCAGRGEAWFPPEHLGRVLRELRADVERAQHGAGPLDVLTPRERDVLLRLAQGSRPADIARELGVSTNTVRTHTNKIFVKLGVHSRLQAVAVARGALSHSWPPPADVPAPRTAQQPITSMAP